MATRKRTQAQRAIDLAFIERLHIRGYGEIAIAEAISKERPYTLSRQQIGYDLRRLASLWQEEAKAEFDTVKAEELARIKALQQEYWQAWQDSKEETKKTAVKGRGKGSKPDYLEKTETTEERHGNPQYLAGVQWCIEQRLKIYGVYAATKQENTGTIIIQHVNDWRTGGNE